jgi:hypothetical protein
MKNVGMCWVEGVKVVLFILFITLGTHSFAEFFILAKQKLMNMLNATVNFWQCILAGS